MIAIIEVFFKYTYSNIYGINILYWGAIILLILMAGLRTDSIDITAYHIMHVSLAQTHESYDWRTAILEPGFKLIFKLLANVDFQWSLFLSAFIGVFLKGVFLKRYSPYLFLSLVIYFTTTFMIKEMGQIRHGMAMGIALFAFEALFKKKTFRFIFMALLATMFHWSALCLFPLLIFYKKRPSNLFYFIFIGAILPLCFVDLKLYMFPILSNIGIPAVETKVTLYGSMYDTQFISQLGLNSSLILLYVTFIIQLILRRRLSERYSFFPVVLNIYFLGIIYYVFFNSVSEFGQRTTVYFRMLDMVIYPLILSSLFFERWILTILLCANSYLTLYKRSNDPSMQPLFPYQNIFNAPHRAYT